MSEQETILVQTTGQVERSILSTRPESLPVQALADNVNLFLSQVSSILAKAPETVGEFRLVKLNVSAEISAEGKLVLLGAGVEAAATGGLEFEFARV